MKSIADLKRAAREGLEAIHRVKDLMEGEIFVSSNAHLVARLAYTSHIPCDGLEEPKSTESFGVGVRALFRGRDGTAVGFGSEPGRISVEAVLLALDKARRGAVRDPEMTTLPRPTGEPRRISRYHDPGILRMSDEDLVASGWKVLNGALSVFSRSQRLRRAARSQGVDLASLGLIVSGDVTAVQERMAIASTAMPQVQSDESGILISSITAMIERLEAKGSGWATAVRFSDFSADAGSEAAKNALRAIGGERVEDGVYRMLLGSQPVADLLNNLILPSMNLANLYAESSAFLGMFGKKIASEDLSLYDDGAAKGFIGSKGITCEGLATGRTELIKDGIFVGALSNFYERERILRDPRAKLKLGIDPNKAAEGIVPRNGFRFSDGGGRAFDQPPDISATNVFLEGNREASSQRLLSLVKEGLYIGRIWYTYPINGLSAGDFTCTVVGDSYRIANGRLAAPIRPNTIRIDGNIRLLLNGILAVGRRKKGTPLWASDAVIYAPQIVVSGLPVRAIGSS